jgi:hypothetical protein
MVPVIMALPHHPAVGDSNKPNPHSKYRRTRSQRLAPPNTPANDTACKYEYVLTWDGHVGCLYPETSVGRNSPVALYKPQYLCHVQLNLESICNWVAL